MSWKKILAVIRREYLERVRTKAFWIATIIVPAFFFIYMAVQISAIKKTSGERKIVVVDTTGRLAPALTAELVSREEAMRREKPGTRGIHWIVETRPVTGDLEQTKEVLRKEVLDEKIYGYLVLDPALLEKDRAEYSSI
jgi:ABC-2 type transport system permease protein